MKTKKLSRAMIFLAITIIAYIVASVLFCYTTKPEISKGEFPFSITYEYKGETGTVSGVLECEYSGSETIHGEHTRYWNQEAIYDNPKNVEKPFMIVDDEVNMTSLSVHENMYAGYLMGDPLYKDYYTTYGDGGMDPYVEYYDYKTNITLDDETKDEVLASINFKIVDYTYADPIENSFSFSGISYEADNVIIFIAILTVFFLLCLIFVRKDEEIQYSKLDKTSIVCNYLIGILVIPFISITCILFGVVGSNSELLEQIIYNVPSIAILCLALSVVFRRKGYSKAGFVTQFGSISLFAILILVDTLI